MSKRIFLSCTSAEFAEHRDQLVCDLRRPNLEVKAHEEVCAFNSGLTTLEKLDDYISKCTAVIHLVGEGTGCEVGAPQIEAIVQRYPDLATELPSLAPLLAPGASWRGSYTQWEAYLAVYHIRKGTVERCYVYRATPTAPRADGFKSDNTSTRLQAEHYARMEALGRDRHDFASREDLRTQTLNHLLDMLSRRSEPLNAEPSNLWKLQTKPDGVFEGREQVVAHLNALWADALAEKAGRAQIVSLVAVGGAGKTTVASRWKDALLAREDHGGVERYFDWSFYSQGTQGERGSAGAHSAADATVFVAAALKFFGDERLADSAAAAWDKGARLATLAAQYRTLLILDGLEPLQHPPGPQAGELKDDAIRALFEGLKSVGQGLCVVTTRETITDLGVTEGATTPRWPLDHLTDAAGAAVLRGHGVVGPQAELEAASREVKGHALTLALIGRYLRLAFQPPDIARRDCFRFEEADAEDFRGHAFRVFAAYGRWLEQEDRHVELAILRLLGLFDRPATPDCLAALCAAPPIPGLTNRLVGIGEKQWAAALKRLRDLDLIETVDWAPTNVSGYSEPEAQAAVGRPEHPVRLGTPHPLMNSPVRILSAQSLDAHPLLREYFDTQLNKNDQGRAAHLRLYRHLCASVPYWPEGRDGLVPLYQAVVHGCHAGSIKAALDVYMKRIKRGTVGGQAQYSTSKLGLSGMDLAAVACFFAEPWSRLLSDLEPADEGWLLAEASFALTTLNRLSEALEPMRVATRMSDDQRDWDNATISYTNVSQLELALGMVSAAAASAAQAVTLADRSSNGHLRMTSRAVRASALHQAGRLEEGQGLFAEAEMIQARRQPKLPLLYSLQGYEYCDFLLATVERAAWQSQMGVELPEFRTTSALSALAEIERRATRVLQWAENVSGVSLVDMGVANLALGRVHLLRTLFPDSHLTEPSPDIRHAQKHLSEALDKLRKSSRSMHVAGALRHLAWLHVRQRDWNGARGHLDEAFGLATRGANARKDWQGGMRLHLADTLLHRARLFGMRGGYPWPGRTSQMDLDEAAALIDICGYHRRDGELADARAALASR